MRNDTRRSHGGTSTKDAAGHGQGQRPTASKSRPGRISQKRRSGSRVLTIATWVLGLMMVFPFVWMIIQALQPNDARFAYPPIPDPARFTGDGFATAVGSGEIITWLRNSSIVALVSTAISLVAGAGAAYALARYRGRSVSASGFLILASQMVPPVVVMVPLFSMVTWAGLFDSLTAVILGNVAFTLPVVTWMLSGSFRAIPIELEEAGMVDGCNRLGVLFRITLPASLPGVAAAAAFSFNWAWQEFLFSRLVISSGENWVGGMGIASFLGVFDTPWDAVMAATVIFTVAPVLFFLMAQRGFVNSVGGGLKG
ncbi:carbohydrate ABC transporter permease [Phytoactinopolyspora alkaliphila]|uniref:Carbohydrate ABC transporter permease n=1 Tax=Phytoactinopolyspora alkaliphila TaxID=1783498 RepID=A0A6N9YJW2_9ACTN|nr:carbohydrate ABC transporter permease [Phytoactinopolyspora alkaliphila]NED95210.1 carbohydrate ABC transporter permease [Phytoactinopolyspora alkaliphila]